MLSSYKGLCLPLAALLGSTVLASCSSGSMRIAPLRDPSEQAAASKPSRAPATTAAKRRSPSGAGRHAATSAATVRPTPVDPAPDREEPEDASSRSPLERLEAYLHHISGESVGFIILVALALITAEHVLLVVRRVLLPVLRKTLHEGRAIARFIRRKMPPAVGDDAVIRPTAPGR